MNDSNCFDVGKPDSCTITAIEDGLYVVINYLKYFSPLLNNPMLMGKWVEVSYDPFDLGHAWVYVRRNWVECHSELHALFHGKSEQQLSTAVRRIHAWNRAHPLRRRPVNGPLIARILAAELNCKELLPSRQLRDGQNRVLPPELSSPFISETAVVPKQIPEADSVQPLQMQVPVKRLRKVIGGYAAA